MINKTSNSLYLAIFGLLGGSPGTLLGPLPNGPSPHEGLRIAKSLIHIISSIHLIITFLRLKS